MTTYDDPWAFGLHTGADVLGVRGLTNGETYTCTGGHDWTRVDELQLDGHTVGGWAVDAGAATIYGPQVPEV